MSSVETGAAMLDASSVREASDPKAPYATAYIA